MFGLAQKGGRALVGGQGVPRRAFGRVAQTRLMRLIGGLCDIDGRKRRGLGVDHRLSGGAGGPIEQERCAKVIGAIQGDGR